MPPRRLRGMGATFAPVQSAGSAYPLNFTPGSDSLTNDAGRDTFQDGDTATVHHPDGSTSSGGQFFGGKWFPAGTTAAQASADMASLQAQQRAATAVVANAAGLPNVPYVSATPSTSSPAPMIQSTSGPMQTVGITSRPRPVGGPRIQPMDGVSPAPTSPAPMIPPSAPALTVSQPPDTSASGAASATLFGLPIWLVAAAAIGAVFLFSGGQHGR